MAGSKKGSFNLFLFFRFRLVVKKCHQKQFKSPKQPKWLPPWQVVKRVKRRNGPRVKWQKKKKMLPFLSKMKTVAFVKPGKKFKKMYQNKQKLPSLPYKKNIQSTVP